MNRFFLKLKLWLKTILIALSLAGLTVLIFWPLGSQSHQTSSTIRLQPEVQQYTANLGNVVFFSNSVPISIRLCNPTTTTIQLQLANKSCGCADVPSSLVINTHSEQELNFSLGNSIAASGKQRLQLVYQSSSHEDPLVLQLDYYSIVPVYVHDPAVYLDSGLAGQFKVILATMLGEDHQPPKLSDSRYSLISYAVLDEREKTGIRRYEATIGYLATEASQHNLSLNYQYQDRNVQAVFPVTFRDPYVVQEFRANKSDSQSASRTLKVRRYDNKPFTLHSVNTIPHRECHFSSSASATHQISVVSPAEACGTMPDLDVNIEVNSPDTRQLTHRLYGTSFTKIR